MEKSTRERIENLVRNLDKTRAKEGREWMDKEFERILSEVPDEERKLCGQILREELKKRRMEIVNRRDVDVRGEMGELMQALNMSYIAREFFHKDRSWLARRLSPEKSWKHSARLSLIYRTGYRKPFRTSKKRCGNPMFHSKQKVVREDDLFGFQNRLTISWRK